MTIPATRIEWFATEMAALGCKVQDSTLEDGSRAVMVSGAHWMDMDTVFVNYTPASAKDGKGRRDSLFCMVFSTRRYPRKGSAVVEFHQAVSAATMLKDYIGHAHCDAGRHTCHERHCTAIREDDKECKLPESAHRIHTDHTFVPGAAE